MSKARSMSSKNDEVLFEGLYYEWLSELAAYNRELEGIRIELRGLLHQGMDLAMVGEVKALEDKVLGLKDEIDELSDEVSVKRGKLARNKTSEKVIPLAEVIENN